MINCIVVDDEPLAQDILVNYIQKSDQLFLVKKCNTAFEAFEILHHQQVDLMFLDVKMPVLNGIEFLKSLKNPPAVVFTTAYSEFAAVSYELEAIDYLLKPITYERFEKSLAKYFKQQPVADNEEKDYTYFKVAGKLIKVTHATIQYAQSIKDYILLCTDNGNFIVHMTMKYLITLLPESKFARVHRSYVINVSKVLAVAKNQLQIVDKEIPIGESYKDGLSKIAL
jgi:DNA-binding LytR/AlgR family response regulator